MLGGLALCSYANGECKANRGLVALLQLYEAGCKNWSSGNSEYLEVRDMRRFRRHLEQSLPNDPGKQSAMITGIEEVLQVGAASSA